MTLKPVLTASLYIGLISPSFGDHHPLCPHILKASKNVDGWTLAENKDPQTQEWQFYDAWIYDNSTGKSAECHYSPKGGTGAKLKYTKQGVHTDEYAFVANPPLMYNLEHKGYHCKGMQPNPKVDNCPVKKKKHHH